METRKKSTHGWSLGIWVESEMFRGRVGGVLYEQVHLIYRGKRWCILKWCLSYSLHSLFPTLENHAHYVAHLSREHAHIIHYIEHINTREDLSQNTNPSQHIHIVISSFWMCPKPHILFIICKAPTRGYPFTLDVSQITHPVHYINTSSVWTHPIPDILFHM